MADVLHPRRRAHPDRPVRRRARRVRPDDLAAHVRRGAGRAQPGPRPGRGSTTSSSATPTAPARTTATSPAWPCCWRGCPRRCPGATVNRLCGSGLEARDRGQPRDRGRRRLGVHRRRRRVDEPRAVGAAQARARLRPRGHETLHSTTLGWRHGQPADARASGPSRSARAPRSSPSATRSPARSRTRFALRSHQRAAAAWERGAFDDEVVAVPGVDLERDESIRPDTSLGGARPAEARRSATDGTVTAGNSSPLNDGAAALLLADEAGAAAIGREPLARDRAARAAAASSRSCFGIGPVEAANRALARAGIGWGDLARGRAQRGVRRPVAGLPGATGRSSTRRSSTSTAARSRSATRWAAPARAS